MLQALIAVGGTAILYFLIIAPIVSFRSHMQKEFDSNMDKLNKLDTIHEEYRDARDQVARYRSQLMSGQGTTSQIEETAKSLNILRNKVYTRDMPSNIQDKYKKISTDVKFEGVDIKSMIEFIYRMENSGKLTKVSYIRINQALKGRNMYDVTLKLDTLSAP